jgi:penicillin-insensitive murein endopeptidase
VRRIVFISFFCAFLALQVSPATHSEPPAISYGAGRCGKLEGGVALSCSGDNFEAFTSLACLLGRNYLHPLVTETILEAYGELAQKMPNRKWQYGDLGWKNGGSFRPHKTHQNGLSADFFVPMVNRAGEPVTVPTSLFNKFGYGLELDGAGRLKDRTVDWAAITDHLLALEKAGAPYGVSIQRVILAAEFHPLLLRADPRAEKFRDRLIRQSVWIRHDEHYHVDFDIPAKLRHSHVCK